MSIGRIRWTGGQEKWVGFIGGGGFQYAPVTNATTGAIECRTAHNPPDTNQVMGKGFFVVDLSDGSILWSYTAATNGYMKSIFAQPAAVDSDNDGFIDTVYVGDNGGNMWRFTISEAAWSGSRLFSTSTLQPIYTSATVGKDTTGYVWVYWGTGDKQCVNATDGYDRIYAVKDTDRSSTRTLSNLTDISSSTYSNTSGYGWYITLASGEKMLADPTLYSGVVYLTTFTPSTSVCSTGGSGVLYGLNYITGAGALSDGSRKMSLGTGIPTAPLISLNPYTSKPNMYVSTSGGGGSSTAGVKQIQPGIKYPTNPAKIFYWKDTRIK
jgi:Tfp pilus tip-associated adhesin PilY1